MIARALVTIAIVVASSAAPARAERLVASLSTHRVLITSNFTGAELFLFGTVERDGANELRRGGYDIVATVTGPRQTLVTRRKDRVFGIWVNVDSRTFVEVPSYLATLANKPLDGITTPDRLRRLQLGVQNTVLPQRIGPDFADVVPNDPVRMAFVRLQGERERYFDGPNAITFLTPTLFRATIPLPADIPIGTYEVDLKLFANGAVIARTNSAFEIIKVGFEQFVATSAREHGLLYGLATALMAVMTGWLASVVFRKD